ncbi:twin-arginine translocase subunit TatC, partial [Kribbella sp. VKM Ac-2568]|uniref:twin-arginine translocase subunit TatC n=1 Tax=Kribbella sp. VKM Ac-2568 TaxID=2512219 RepID=UPI0010E25331
MSVEQLDPVEEDAGRMSLREHITELRNRLLKCVVAIVLGAVVGWIFYNWALDLLQQPFDTSVKEL